LEEEAAAGGLRCPACLSASFSHRPILPNLVTHTCNECGLQLSTVSRVGEPITEFALVKHDAYMRSVGRTRRRQAKSILSLLTRHVPAGGKLLDVGCSFGFFLDEARRAGFNVRGVEPDTEAYQYATRLLGEDVVAQGTFGPGTVPARSADVISALDLIEHIPSGEHESFARAVSTALSPGGVWLIKVPTTEGLFYRLSDWLSRTLPPVGASLMRRLWQTRYEYPHLVYFSRRTLDLWLDRFGFSVLTHAYVPEVPTGTVLDRLTTDGDISRARAYVMAPAVAAANAIDALRGKTDSLVVIAKPRS
jgi:SAM-dependent methyltransferase